MIVEANVPDVLTEYLKILPTFKLLSRKEEQSLGQAIVEGRDAQQKLLSSQTLAVEEKIFLEGVVKGGQAARETLTCHNLRLVVSIAKKYASSEIGLMDLIQEGNVGLLQAVDKYNHTLGFKFGTYATWWIRQKIYEALATQGRVIQFTIITHWHAIRLATLINQLHQETGVEPTPVELASASGLSLKEVKRALQAMKPLYSLDEILEESGGEIDVQSTEADPAAVVLEREQLQLLQGVLQELDSESQQVLNSLFGLHESPTLTVQDLARELGVSLSVVRQKKKAALEKLRILLQEQ